MNKAIDTNLERHQEELARLIVTTGKALKLLGHQEEENILPLIQSRDRQAFLKKHTVFYKRQLHLLLQTVFSCQPNRETGLSGKPTGSRQLWIP